KTIQIEEELSISKTEMKSFNIKVFTIGDLRPENDSTSKSFYVSESPNFSFDSDTIKRSVFPFTLDAGDDYTSYKWQDGSSNQTFSVPDSGYYKVTVGHRTNSCTTTDSIYVVNLNLNSINEIYAGKIDINIYPNPATYKFFIKLQTELNKGYWLELYDTQNRLVHKEFVIEDIYQQEFTTDNLPKGVYLMRIRGKELYQTHKLIIN
ncbi:MAG: T9SS type A sorting domain-containing protein, partial [Bacteroidales bacterium]|nr:T9SS type A sorting domain-containing protein [Bacteroidales bacterium]